MNMLKKLDAAEKLLPRMLRDGESWNSLLVNYERPHVERLWRPWGTYRISLHVIHHCGSNKPLFHPHRWPSAIRVCSGTYEMLLGSGDPTQAAPPTVARIILKGHDAYEMSHPYGWHSVRPLSVSSLSVMVSGPPWPNAIEVVKKRPRLEVLGRTRVKALIKDFQSYYR